MKYFYAEFLEGAIIFATLVYFWNYIFMPGPVGQLGHPDLLYVRPVGEYCLLTTTSLCCQILIVSAADSGNNKQVQLWQDKYKYKDKYK